MEDGKIALKEKFDYIFICFVLHHLSDSQIKEYLQGLRSILNPGGGFIIFEPFYAPDSRLNNIIMKFFDDGEYIRTEKQYLDLFKNTKVLKKFRVVNGYRALFFSAK